MSFASDSDVIARIEGGAATLAVLTGVDPFDAGVLASARGEAYGLIRARVGVRYTLPADLSPYPAAAALLRGLELDLVEEALWGRVREQLPERVKAKAKAARELLEAIAAGEALLPDAADLAAGEAGSAAVTGSQRVFTREDMRDVF